MEKNRIASDGGLGGYFENFRKSRSFSYGYSEFIVAIARADGLKKSPKTENDQQENSEIVDDNDSSIDLQVS